MAYPWRVRSTSVEANVACLLRMSGARAHMLAELTLTFAPGEQKKARTMMRWDGHTRISAACQSRVCTALKLPNWRRLGCRRVLIYVERWWLHPVDGYLLFRVLGQMCLLYGEGGKKLEFQHRFSGGF